MPTNERSGVREELAAFRRGCAARCGDFALVRDVADATKHARLDRDDARIKDFSEVHHRVEASVDRGGRPIVTRSGSPLATSGVAVALPGGSRHPLPKLPDGAPPTLRVEMAR